MKFFRICLICSLSGSMPVAAQQLRQLERADSLLVAGQYEMARSALADWQKANPRDAVVDPAVRAHALYLGARLTTKAADAREQYLALVLSYPTAREAPDALLRLGQGFLAADQPSRAIGYLERLVNDYPTAPNRPQALLWLTRAQIAAGNNSTACTTAGAALKAGITDADIHALLQEEEKTACAAPPPKAPPVTAARPVPPTPRRSTSAAASTPSRRTTSSGRFTLQAGAFREVASANAIAASLRRKGFDARVVYVGSSTLARVRVGRFSSSEDAAAQARKLKSAGTNTIIVDDATRERSER